MQGIIIVLGSIIIYGVLGDCINVITKTTTDQICVLAQEGSILLK